MSDPIRLEMTQELIDIGQKCVGNHCPIAELINTLDWTASIYVGVDDVTFFRTDQGPTWPQVELGADDELNEVIEHYDETGEMWLGTLVLDLTNATATYERKEISYAGRDATQD